MKILLLAFTTLLFASSVQLAALQEPEPDRIARMRTIKIINDVRRSYAKENNIANMHELEWNSELMLLSKSLAIGCPDESILLANKKFQVIPVLRNNQKDIPFDPVELARIARAHLTNPVQTEFGDGDKALFECKNKKNKEDYNVIYVLGPENKEIIKHGAPGSQCNAGSVNKDGLCVKKA